MFPRQTCGRPCVHNRPAKLPGIALCGLQSLLNSGQLHLTVCVALFCSQDLSTLPQSSQVLLTQLVFHDTPFQVVCIKRCGLLGLSAVGSLNTAAPEELVLPAQPLPVSQRDKPPGMRRLFHAHMLPQYDSNLTQGSCSVCNKIRTPHRSLGRNSTWKKKAMPTTSTSVQEAEAAASTEH